MKIVTVPLLVPTATIPGDGHPVSTTSHHDTHTAGGRRRVPRERRDSVAAHRMNIHHSPTLGFLGSKTNQNSYEVSFESAHLHTATPFPDPANITALPEHPPDHTTASPCLGSETMQTRDDFQPETTLFRLSRMCLADFPAPDPTSPSFSCSATCSLNSSLLAQPPSVSNH